MPGGGCAGGGIAAGWPYWGWHCQRWPYWGWHYWGWRCQGWPYGGVTLPGVAVPRAGGDPARPGHLSRWRGPLCRAKYTQCCGALSPLLPATVPAMSPPGPCTFLLAGEGHQVVTLAGLQRLLLQVLQQGLPIQRPRWALLRLVPLPQPRRQQHVLGTHRVTPWCLGGTHPARHPPTPGPTSGSISSSSKSSCASSSADSSRRILSSSMSRYFSSSCR